MSSQPSLTLCHKSLCTVFSPLLTNILWHSPWPSRINTIAPLNKVGSYEQGPNVHNDYLQQLDVTLKNGHTEGEWARSKDQHITNAPHQGPWKLDCFRKNILSPLTSSLSQALVSFFLTRDKEREVHSN